METDLLQHWKNLKICAARRNSSMDEDTLQALSRALTHLVFRNGAVEDLHAVGAVLDDTAMEQLNRDVHNRFYTLLAIWFNGTGPERDRLEPEW